MHRGLKEEERRATEEGEMKGERGEEKMRSLALSLSLAHCLNCSRG